MKLTILGSGTMMPAKKRYPSGYLLDSGSSRILLDAGAPTLARLVEQGVLFRDVEALCFTHFHTDHFGGFLPFVHARWVDDIMTHRQHIELLVMGPKTLSERWKKLREVSWPETDETFPLRMVEGPAEERLGSLTVSSFPVNHVKWFPSVGYRCESGGKTLVYTGDIGSDHAWDDLVARVQQVDLLLIEAGASAPAPNHFTIDQVLKLQREASVKRVLITHVRDQQLPVLRSKLQGNPSCSIAEDNMTIEI